MTSESPYSHPQDAVRHSYPLAVTDRGFATALALFTRTLPYALARFGILLAVSLASIVWYAVTFVGGAWLGLHVHTLAGWVWVFTGFSLGGYLWWTLVRYALYLLKAGHVAVLTELITHGQIGSGAEGMLAYGKRVVTERFGQVNAMFALDVLVHGIVTAFNRTLTWVTDMLPIPGLQGIVGVVTAIVRAATTFIDEAIFSYSLARGDDDAFRSARDGLIYYAQNSRTVLKTGVWMVVIDKAASFAVWFVMLAPAYVITWLLPSSVAGVGGFFSFVVAALFAWNVRAAFVEPLLLTWMLLEFHVAVREQPIDLVWDERLSAASAKFVELKTKITGERAHEPAVRPGLPVSA
jgi:hypothetical protein